MKLCDWCGESLPDDGNDFITLEAEHWPYSKCQNRKVQIELHDECCGALVGILRESPGISRPKPVEQKRAFFRGVRGGVT